MNNRTRIENLSRRDFLKQGGGLTLALVLPGVAAAAGAGPGIAGTAPVVKGDFTPNAFVRIGSDDTVTVIAKHLEMGQGTYTGLATLVAEELDADWGRVTVEGAPADAGRYNNLFWGPAQGTGGSTAIANSFMQLRQAGAAARAMLVSAAAARWQVPVGEITVREGVVSHAASGRSARFGELAEAAAVQPVPTEPVLKDPSTFRLIGRHVPRKDSLAKTTGKAMFTQDVRLPGMLVAVVAHPPRFGATVRAVRDDKARAQPGVVDVVRIPTGVAVLAKDTWSAKKGRDALEIDWDESAAWRGSTEAVYARYRELAGTPGKVARRDGDAEVALGKAARVIEAEYELPFLAHAAMEPMNCVVRLDKDRCEVWNGEQFQTGDQHALAALLGLKPENVHLNMLYAGGSFGRRANPHSDYLLEAASIVKAINGRAPVKMVWMREDDMRGGHYRPAYVHSIRAALDGAGRPLAWSQRIVGQSIIAGTAFESGMVKDGIDATSVEGAANLPYAVPNLQVELHTTNAEVRVPVQWWRSVGSSHTGFATEVFLDELASAAGADPVDYRLALLEAHPRHAAVLRLAADGAGWKAPLAKREGVRRGRGVALHESFNTIVAQVAEVSLAADGSYTVDRVVCALDCGVAVNPDVIRAQMEGGIGFALTAALAGEISFDDGKVVQSNFHDYTMLRINQMPKVEVHIVPSAERPTGVGEPGVPPLAPALVNALFAAGGKRIRRLPIGEQLKA
ncbi:xanthine dehydrogenase family protein molybdopterin-binding subunit [Cognatazoarcus halotolerans]|uniref:xanthine dehydrogenase family protein molybdopterin-binding subunit n=1 Tax=Cognatazoarcus halotolerans TaxID=2686016 RepID=UPI00135A0EC6|nr:xanthine dehydrogenase family protein molybdopterin-binding subunit [Cognatazoarcus halotolerans]MCB1900568.1 xanthine dehydrogenase family protein molybdopterin-binding subunit [Rhodocyclaceae bacterium]MCP5310580.1 xanthine dehydrogenase family protein molybdopterin-binding subunit [Zoogloeaceae bacterium]